MAPEGDAGGRELLVVEGLSKTFRVAGGGMVQAGRAIGLRLGAGQVLGVVGESGSGKSTLARLLMGLERPDAGSIRLDGVELAGVPPRRRGAAMLRALQMVFQNPDETLNPAYRVGTQLGWAVRRLDRSGGAIKERVAVLVAAVRLLPGLLARRPAALSGGQKQRVAVARAFAGQPRLVVADEPVSALDVSVQAAVTRLLLDMRRDHGTALVVISHDLGFIRALSDRVAVLFGGEVMEEGTAEAVFAPPYHPYTQALLGAEAAELPAGRAGAQLETGRGCPYQARCARRLGPVCDEVEPPEVVGAGGHRIRCHIPLAELMSGGSVLGVE